MDGDALEEAVHRLHPGPGGGITAVEVVMQAHPPTVLEGQEYEERVGPVALPAP